MWSFKGNYNDSLRDAKVAAELNPACIEAIVRGRHFLLRCWISPSSPLYKQK